MNDISILINSYQPEEKDLLTAINGCLNQIGVNVSIIIITIEDDPTINIINQLNNSNIKLVTIKKIDHPGKGPKGIYYQLNEGIKHIKTRFFSYFSSNDIIYPHKSINEITKIINNNAIFCFSSFLIKYSSKITKFDYPTDKMNYNNLLTQNFINDCATIDLIKLPKEMLYFDYKKFENHSYWNLWLTIVKKYGVKSFVYNNNPEWEYIRDINKSQSLQRKNNIQEDFKNKNLQEYLHFYHNNNFKFNMNNKNNKYSEIIWKKNNSMIPIKSIIINNLSIIKIHNTLKNIEIKKEPYELIYLFNNFQNNFIEFLFKINLQYCNKILIIKNVNDKYLNYLSTNNIINI
jgi:hypothetical protein